MRGAEYATHGRRNNLRLIAKLNSYINNHKASSVLSEDFYNTEEIISLTIWGRELQPLQL